MKIENFSAELKTSNMSLLKESEQKSVILLRHEDFSLLKNEKNVIKFDLDSRFKQAQFEPDRIARQSESIEKAILNMMAELRGIQRKIESINKEVQKQHDRREEAEKLRVSLDEKLQLHRETIEERERDISSIKLSLDSEKANSHDLITKKIEKNLKKKEVDSLIRHYNEQLVSSKKEYDQLKRQLKKKRGIADAAEQVLPVLLNQLRDEELAFKTFSDESEKNKKLIAELKGDVDTRIVQLLQQEGVEQATKVVTISSNIISTFFYYTSFCRIIYLYIRI